MRKFDGEPASQVLKFAQEKGVVTTFDLLGLPQPNLAEIVEVCLPYIDFFMPNFEESQMICGLSEVEEILGYFLDRGARHVVLRLGEKGSVIAWQENGSVKQIKVPAFEVPVVDSTGCGDGYNAGFIKGLSLKWDLEQCGRLGSACGGLVIQGLGSDAGIENFEQVLEFARTAQIKA